MIDQKPDKTIFLSLIFTSSFFLSGACRWMKSLASSPTPTQSIMIEQSPTPAQPSPMAPSPTQVQPTVEESSPTVEIPATQPYLQAGQVEWMTLPQMYDPYVDWEQMNR